MQYAIYKKRKEKRKMKRIKKIIHRNFPFNFVPVFIFIISFFGIRSHLLCLRNINKSNEEMSESEKTQTIHRKHYSMCGINWIKYTHTQLFVAKQR